MSLENIMELENLKMEYEELFSSYKINMDKIENEILEKYDVLLNDICNYFKTNGFEVEEGSHYREFILKFKTKEYHLFYLEDEGVYFKNYSSKDTYDIFRDRKSVNHYIVKTRVKTDRDHVKVNTNKNEEIQKGILNLKTLLQKENEVILNYSVREFLGNESTKQTATDVINFIDSKL